jgi:CRP/FNR family transcriptional regulator
MPAELASRSKNRGLLLGLPKEYSDRLFAQARSVDLAEAEPLFHRGDPGDGCYWLERGTLKVMVQSATGEERILAVLGPGTVVGEMAMMDGLPRSATVVALRPAHLRFLSRSHFQECLAENPSIQSYLLSTLVERLRQADEEAAAASFLTVKAKVARALLHLAIHLGERTRKPGQILVETGLRQSDLAALAGVARESVSRTLSEWRARGIVGPSTRSKYLINSEKLEREALATE